MPTLDAALAFALTMLVVATVCTQIVRFLQTLASTRSKVLREMLQGYFEQELKPVVSRELKRLSTQLDKAASEDILSLAESLGAQKVFSDEELGRLTHVTTTQEKLQHAASSEAPTSSAGADLEPLQASLADCRAQIRELELAGFPIGWSYYPAQSGSAYRLRWLLGLVLTAICAGLGSPFWYDAVRGLARLTQRSGSRVSD